MKNLPFILICLLFVFSCKEDPIKNEVKKAVLQGKVSIKLPRINEAGIILDTVTYSQELDSLQIQARYNGIVDTAWAVNGKFSMIRDYYSQWFLFYKVNDSISREFVDMPFQLNQDTTNAECYVTSLFNKNQKMKLYRTTPHPARSNFSMRFSIDYDGLNQLDIVDLQGRLVFTVDRGYRQAGTYEAQITKALPKSGIYFFFARSPGIAYSYSAFYYKKD